MPPVPPDYRMRARRRMAMGLNPAAVEARNRFLASRGEHYMQSQPMQPASRQTPVFAPGDETVRLSNGNEVSRDVVDRVKARWQAALKMAQQMDAPPPGQPGGPIIKKGPPRILPSAPGDEDITLRIPTPVQPLSPGVIGAWQRTPGTRPVDQGPMRRGPSAAAAPAMTPGLQKFLAQMAARRRGRR